MRPVQRHALGRPVRGDIKGWAVRSTIESALRVSSGLWRLHIEYARIIAFGGARMARRCFDGRGFYGRGAKKC